MSHPKWNLSDRDVVIIGAGYGALIVGAILARHGARPLLLTELDRAGLAGGAYPYSPKDGGTWWLDFGRRDSHGEQDFVLVTREWHLRAAERAGVTLPLVGPLQPTMRTHRLPEGIVASFSVSNPEETMPFLQETLGLDSELSRRFLELLAMFSEMPQAQAGALINETFETWFARHDYPQDVQNALYALLVCIYSLPPESTSVGRFALHYARSTFNLHVMNDFEVGGMQGACQPYIRAIEAAGGEIWTDMKPTTLLRDGAGAVKGLVARTTQGFVREIRTKIIIFSEPAFRLLDLVPAAYLTPEFIEQAKSTREWEMPMINLFMGLSTAPTRRSDGKRDDFPSWNRVMLGSERVYGGGWIISSIASQRAAPPGKHLLEVCFADSGVKREGGRLAKMTYEELKAEMDQLVDYLYSFYADLDDIVEWSEYSYTIEAGGHHWAYKAGDRVPVIAPIPGLYMQGYTTDTQSAYYEAEEYSAVSVADLVLNRLSGAD
jgi:phytoene dehydrogenase-like protein